MAVPQHNNVEVHVVTNRWWDGQADERYWLEATDRTDIGADLRAPN